MAHDVFISYSTQDKPVADAVCAALEANDIRCWIAPRDVMLGMDWPESIHHAINDSKLMVLVLSSNANKSKDIEREINIAINKGKIVIPLRIEDIPPSEGLQYFIGNLHWLDALTPPLEKHLELLVNDVSQVLKKTKKPRNSIFSITKHDQEKEPEDNESSVNGEKGVFSTHYGKYAKFCTLCGRQNASDVKFCTHCGTCLEL
jgi:hypothetical protein